MGAARQLVLPPDWDDLVYPTPWSKSILDPEAHTFAYYGGRGSGKTRNIGHHLAEQCSFRPLRGLVARKHQKNLNVSSMVSLQISIQELGLEAFWYPKFLGRRSKVGSTIEYIGLDRNIEEVKGMEDLDFLWIEEASNVLSAYWYIIEPTIGRKKGFKLYLSFNPVHEDDWCSEYMGGRREASQKGVVSMAVNWQQNPFWLPRMESTRLKWQDKAPQLYPHMYEGEFYSKVSGMWVTDKEWADAEDKSITFDSPDTRWFIGIDGSTTDDLFSICYLGVQGQRWIAKWRVYICQDMIELNKQQSYKKWVKKGVMTVVGTTVIDQDPIREQLYQDCLKLNPELIGIDHAWISQLKAYFDRKSPKYRDRMINVGQTCATMDHPMRLLREKVRNKTFCHDGNPVAKWCMGNVTPSSSDRPSDDVYDLMNFDESDSGTQVRAEKVGDVAGNKIDCIDALLDAIYVAESSPKRNQAWHMYDEKTGQTITIGN